MINFITSLDQFASELIITIRTPWLTTFFRGFTHLGSAVAIIIITLSILSYFASKRDWRNFSLMFITVAGAGIISEILKLLINRERPIRPWLISTTGFSFPSGHSLVSMVLYGYLAYLIYKRILPLPKVRQITLILMLFPFLIGFSRLYLGVHYLSDVLGGWLIGLIWLGIISKFIRKSKV